MKQFDLDEHIECAVRERAAKAHMKSLEKSIAHRHRRFLSMVSAAAAVVLIAVLGLDVKLSYDMRLAGYAFDPVEGQSGGSEITALMEIRKIDEALELIDKARLSLLDEIRNPVSDDSDYVAQLQIDSEELDFLEAVCYMRQGKYIKAKRLLRKIAMSDGHFSHEAEYLLDNI